VITVAVAVPAGYSLARLVGRWGERMGIGIFFTYLIPPTLLFVPFSRLISLLGLQDSLGALILIYPTMTIPFCTWLVMGFLRSVPWEIEEQAMIDGASPLRILISVIIPQSIPVLTAVGLFHFFFAWNDFFQPLIYLQGNADAQPLSVGIAVFNALYSQKPTLIQTAAIMSIFVPVAIFFFAQRAFMRGIVITGVEK